MITKILDTFVYWAVFPEKLFAIIGFLYVVYFLSKMAISFTKQ